MRATLYEFLFVYSAISIALGLLGFSIAASDSIGCEPLKFTRRWHYVFPAHYVGCWMGEKIER